MWRVAIFLVWPSIAHAQVVEASGGLGVRVTGDEVIAKDGMTEPNVAAEFAIGGHIADATVLMARIATTFIPLDPLISSTLIGPHVQFWLAKDIFISGTVGAATFLAIPRHGETDAYLGYGYGLQMGGPFGASWLSVDYSSHHFGHPHGDGTRSTMSWGVSLLIGREWR